MKFLITEQLPWRKDTENSKNKIDENENRTFGIRH